MPAPLEYSLVIATYERAEELRTTLASIAAQTRPPAAVIVVDSSPDDKTRAVVEAAPVPVRYERAKKPSAAVQRNQGAALVTTPIVAFVDDDVFVPPDSFEKIVATFDADTEEKIGGIAARIDGMQHRVPSGLLRCYYRLQAGYPHPTYGGKLFGAAINCLPTYTESDSELIPADWLNSTCVFYRTPLYAREKFPEFEGYSFLEDVHLSARVSRTHQLYFHRTATFEHRDAPSTFKRNTRELARMRVRHQRLVAHDILGLREPVLTWKLLLHRLFASISILRQRGPTWQQELLGTWT
ncbi:glycosyl transferase family 2 [Chthoniobacter flavus Ellin428]|uniref:Glycosyl transferase family 2 n=1 Tax=Chthoniobacter flavus Ellin428 TaxID=497964 RepID=B4D5E7_9BACT|nr:glycosyltransferase [Chthoniobacter flavus]EDY18352.1 glycosyl transferase family 2 [Chthoniobacter flavus Ellin428]TCO91374.1 GT2 family glycosyltransferase [Chthoniobacter flavus]